MDVCFYFLVPNAASNIQSQVCFFLSSANNLPVSAQHVTTNVVLPFNDLALASWRGPSLPKPGNLSTTSVHITVHFLNLSPIPGLGGRPRTRSSRKPLA